MRINKQELFAIASQTSQNFDREGVLLIKERQDSFFRKSEGYSPRWFRLRGNLLFYLKGPEPGYEPLGLIVLGNHQVSFQNQDENGHWPFQLVWENGVCYRLSTLLESERTLWLEAMSSAPYEYLNQRLVDLQRQLDDPVTTIDLKKYRTMNKILHDFNEIPLCELSLSCDNLLCDGNGNPPSAFAVVFVVFLDKNKYVRYGCTEIVKKCSNPNFMRTVMFHKSDDITADVKIRVVVYNMRELVSQTGAPIGSATMLLGHLQEAQRLRVPLTTTKSTVGFVTFNVWSLERTVMSPICAANPEKNTFDLSPKLPAHRRSRSLPPSMGLKLQYPTFSTFIRHNFIHPLQASYHFHSGLGGNIITRESMSEPCFSVTMPLQLVELFIVREQELQDTMMAFAEVSKRQSQEHNDYVANYHNTMQLLKVTLQADDFVNLHLSTIKELEAIRDHMLGHSVFFKASVRKISELTESPLLAYIPVNLHLQSLWAHNDSLNKKGFHDVITVGAFTLHSTDTTKPGGLLRLLHSSKDVNSRKAEMTANTKRLDAEFEKLRKMKILQRKLITYMESTLMRLFTGFMVPLRQDMEGIRSNANKILDMWDAETTAEALSKVGWSKRRIDVEDAERKRADQLALQARLMEPGGIAQRTACAAAAITAVADLCVPSLVDRAVVTTSIADIVNGKNKLRTAAGVAAGIPGPKIPGEEGPLIIDAGTPEFAREVQAVALASNQNMKMISASARAHSEVDCRKYYNYMAAKQTKALLGVKRSLSESDMGTRKFSVPRNDCGKKGEIMAGSEHGAEGKVSASGVDSAGVSEDNAAEKVTGTGTSAENDTENVTGSGTSAENDAENVTGTGTSAENDAENVTGTGTSAENDAENVTSTSSSNATAISDQKAVSGLSAAGPNGLRTAGPRGLSAAGPSGSTGAIPKTGVQSKRGKPRGCKHNRAPRLTKQERKQANREALQMAPGGQSREQTSQFERLLNKHGNYSGASLDQITLGNILFNKIGTTTRKTKKNRREPAADPDPDLRSYNSSFFRTLNQTVREMIAKLFTTINTILLKEYFTPYELEEARILMDLILKLLEEIQKWARMTHAAMRIDTETPSWASDYKSLQTRRDICDSQAITSASAGLISWAANTPSEIVVQILQSGLGPLLGFEGLLAIYADELTMWGDMVIAVEDLHTVSFKFVKVLIDHPFVPQVTGARNALVIEIPVRSELYDEIEINDVSPTFTVTAVFFNIGINDKASVAESLGDNKLQYQSNRDNFDRLLKYYNKYCECFPQHPFEQFQASSRGKPLEEVMENLRSAIQNRASKNVVVLQLASQATRLMHGVRFTSCKSAKDRTGMSVTLEQAKILSDEYHLADEEFIVAVDTMRSEGCRRENTLKNTGQRKYAFSKQQVLALPEAYRPPIGCYGSVDQGSKR